MKHMFMNRNLLRLMILMKLKRKKLRSGLKTKKKEERLLKITNFFKKRKKQEEDQDKEKAMWKQLGELNQEFRDIKQYEKNPEKCLNLYLKCN